MGLALCLNNKEDADLLSWVISDAIERWKDQELEQVQLIAEDPTIKSTEQMLELAGSLPDMRVRLEHIRDMILWEPELV